MMYLIMLIIGFAVFYIFQSIKNSSYVRLCLFRRANKKERVKIDQARKYMDKFVKEKGGDEFIELCMKNNWIGTNLKYNVSKPYHPSKFYMVDLDK